MRGSWFFAILLIAGGVGLAALLFGNGEPIGGLDADQFGSLLYAGIWAAVLAAGLVTTMRGRWGEAFRNAAIWGLLFLAVIGLYAFRGEHAFVRDRIAAELIPGYAVSNASTGEVTIMLGADRHFHVDADINGRSVPLLVDTGASVIAIDRDVAERLGIDPERLNYSSRVRTANGIARAAEVRLDSVRIGPIERRNVSAVVTEGPGIGISLLGMSFLGTLSSVDFRGDRLLLRD